MALPPRPHVRSNPRSGTLGVVPEYYVLTISSFENSKRQNELVDRGDPFIVLGHIFSPSK